MDSPSVAIALTLVAASLPFVISILAALGPSSRVRTVDQFFLDDRRVTMDDFLKTTVGYSLQVASIFLFFFWTLKYGVYSLLVPAAWTLGYVLLAWAIKRRKLDRFLGSALASPGSQAFSSTIHGYVSFRSRSDSSRLRRVALLVLALASVIGVGGTMLTEIDYSTKLLTQSISLKETSDSLEMTIHVAILSFTLLYVLWGGYRAVIFTERVQVPLAYIAFGVFAFGLGAYAQKQRPDGVVWLLLLAYWLVTILLLTVRLVLLRRTDPTNVNARATAFLTFGPLILLGLGAAFYLRAFNFESSSFLRVIKPTDSDGVLGFGLWGALSLVLANAAWQFIDISSLQRLQSLSPDDVSGRRNEVCRTIRVTGYESGAGWLLIVVAALVVKVAGIDDINTLLGNLLNAGGWATLLVPIFAFAVVVFMLSTISTFISALAYIAHFDIVPALELSGQAANDRNLDLQRARLTTVLSVIFLYAGYWVLRANVGENISAVLYAIYAFQLAITPSVIASLFLPQRTSHAGAVVLSTSVGLIAAWMTATLPPESVAEWVSADSWYVIPPLAVVLCATVTYVVANLATSLRPRAA